MPNQRKKGKKSISAWAPEELHRRLQAIADEKGMPLSDVVLWIVKEELPKYEYEDRDNRERGKSTDKGMGSR